MDASPAEPDVSARDEIPGPLEPAGVELVQDDRPDPKRRARARVARTAPVGEDATGEPDPDSPPGDSPGEGELPDSLQATSPLLSRAFRSTGHQRSVITQTIGDDQG
jgi:hypothetical protein